MSKISFKRSGSNFFADLRARTDRYFQENKLPQSATPAWIAIGLGHLLLMVGLYVVLVFFTPPLWASIPLCILLGANLAFTGFNLMHSAAHGSFSENKWLNELGAFSLNLMGGNAFYWKVKHNINHHTYTNIDGHDGDIDPKPFLRLHEGQAYHPLHRYQHYYFWAIYSLSYISWVFVDDYKKYFTGAIVTKGQAFTKPSQHVVFWLSKAAYLTVYLVIPSFILGVGTALLGWLIAALTCGIVLAFTFQLAHVMGDVDFPVPNDKNQIENEWAQHQLATTVNFGTGSPLLQLLMGGLNFQVEHHLFPRIHHCHYPAMNKILIETCREYGVPYYEYSSMWTALLAHRDHLRDMSVEQPAHVMATA